MDAEFATKHRMLGTRFINRVVNQTSTIDQYATEIGQGTVLHLTELRQLIHQIAGTAATFGFKTISDHAEVIQTELEKFSSYQASGSSPALRDMLWRLNGAIREAAVQRSINHS